MDFFAGINRIMKNIEKAHTQRNIIDLIRI